MSKGSKEEFLHHFCFGVVEVAALSGSSHQFFPSPPLETPETGTLGKSRIQRHTLRACRVFLPVLGAILPSHVAGFQTSQAVSGAPAPAGQRNFASAAGLRMVASNSRRVAATDDPCIVSMQRMMAGQTGIVSLAQGIVHWQPPQDALKDIQAACMEPSSHSYCADDGLPELREALKAKLASDGITRSEVMVCSGSNQAYTNLAIALLDDGDAAVIFAPYYFNHKMALQMTGCSVVVGHTDNSLLPDMGWLRARLAENPKVKMVTIVNPGNPTGVLLPHDILEEASEICKAAGAWLVVDNAYEYFTYEGEGHGVHTCVEGDHVVNTFSFSKAFGMMGWRIGYLAYPPSIKSSLLKVQDTIPICPPILSQKLALAVLSMDGGAKPWVKERVASLASNKALMMDTLKETLGQDSIRGGSGAIYLMCKLPETCSADLDVVEWLVKEHRVAVIPGSACGFPGWLRVCYSNLDGPGFQEACARLRKGLEAIAKGQVEFKVEG